MPERRRFDTIIVGARCAGAALGTFLARSGSRVLLLDRDALPSDQILSTHTIHPPGVDVLDELGVGDAVREVTPVTETVRFRKGAAWADVAFGEGRDELCPRRERLDGLLQDQAVTAGAELRDRTKVTRVVFEDGRAVGVEARHDGRDEVIYADLVVGADGRRSLVAEETDAEEYLGYDAPRAMYWAYWDAPDAWRSAEYAFDMYLAHVGAYVRVIFQTDHDQLLIGSLPPVAEARRWKHDPERALRDNLAGDEFIGPLIDGHAPASSIRGTVKERFFFRRAAGPGWALVGDAGHHKDFVVGDGITEALIQAKRLAEAIGEGSDTALERWWRARDVRALSGYFWGRDEGSLEPPANVEAAVVAKVAKDDRLKAKMLSLPEHQATPYDALSASVILPCVLGLLLRGRLGVLGEVARQGRRAAEYKRALKERVRLLDEVRL